MRRFGLRDDQWERIKNLLPRREGSVGVTAVDNRLFVEAVLYRYGPGMPWRDLPERFGEGTKIHTRFSRWAKSGVWRWMFRHLAADGDLGHARSTAPLCAGLAHSIQVQPCLPEQRIGGAPEVAEDGTNSPVLDEPAAAARLPLPPALRMIGSSSSGQRTATMPPSMPNSTGPMRAGTTIIPSPPLPAGSPRTPDARTNGTTCTASHAACGPSTSMFPGTHGTMPGRGGVGSVARGIRANPGGRSLIAPPRRPEPRLATKCGGCLGAPLVGSQLAPPRAAAPIAPGT